MKTEKTEATFAIKTIRTSAENWFLATEGDYIKIKRKLDPHSLAHQNTDKTRALAERASSMGIGDAVGYKWHSHRWVYQRVAGGVIIYAGQSEEGGMRADIAVFSSDNGDCTMSFSMLDGEGGKSAIMRENRDAVPHYHPNGRSIGWGNSRSYGCSEHPQNSYARSVIAGETLIGDIAGWARGHIKDKHSYRDLKRWLENYVPRKFDPAYLEGVANASFPNFLKNMVENAAPPNEALAALSWRYIYSPSGGGRDRISSYCEETETFTTSRGVELKLSMKEARERFALGEDFPTRWGTMKFDDKTIICGCHTFPRSHIEEFIGLSEPGEETEEETPLQAYNKAHARLMDRLREARMRDREIREALVSEYRENKITEGEYDSKFASEVVAEKEVWKTSVGEMREATRGMAGAFAEMIAGETTEEIQRTQKEAIKAFRRNFRASQYLLGRAPNSRARELHTASVKRALADIKEGERAESAAMTYRAKLDSITGIFAFDENGDAISFAKK